MKRNIGTVDKILRYIIASIICILYLTDVITGTFATIMIIIAAILILTSLFGVCAIYSIFGINTIKKEK
jgi:hypothetical protein